MGAIGAIREELAVLAADFDASTRTVEQCKDIVAEATRIERIAAAVKTQAAAKVAASGSWRESGDRTAAHQLARETGTTIGAAKETLETAAPRADPGRDLPRRPQTRRTHPPRRGRCRRARRRGIRGAARKRR